MASRIQIVARFSNFYPVAGAYLVAHVLLAWLPNPASVISPVLNANLLYDSRTSYLLYSIINLASAILLALVQSAIISFAVRSINSQLILPLNLAPFVGAVTTWAATLSTLLLITSFPNGNYERYLDMVRTFSAFDAKVSRLLFFVVIVASGLRLYGWAFTIGRDKRQVTGYEKKRQ
ncbi:hypothetical protein BC938DRAFT_474671 [Jimgerdemannia flammicorona]|uniref:Uncharacterized protein n=1 Tax=Jimgerdemannia flammicorona TaxID=994334 RepID=A0A433Q1R5_9FUNG|nr:hypothetical protein BC938DRAFT_474671 [Jimgerdemannia flammicorona]